MLWSFRSSKAIIILFFRLSKAFLSLQYHPVYLSQGNEVQGRGKLDKNKKMSGLETYALKEIAVRISVAARTA